MMFITSSVSFKYDGDARNTSFKSNSVKLSMNLILYVVVIEKIIDHVLIVYTLATYLFG